MAPTYSVALSGKMMPPGACLTHFDTTTRNIESNVSDDYHDVKRSHKPFVASNQDGVQHGLVDEEVAHPLGNNDVHLGNWQLNILDLATNQCNLAL